MFLSCSLEAESSLRVWFCFYPSSSSPMMRFLSRDLREGSAPVESGQTFRRSRRYQRRRGTTAINLHKFFGVEARMRLERNEVYSPSSPLDAGTNPQSTTEVERWMFCQRLKGPRSSRHQTSYYTQHCFAPDCNHVLGGFVPDKPPKTGGSLRLLDKPSDAPDFPTRTPSPFQFIFCNSRRLPGFHNVTLMR